MCGRFNLTATPEAIAEQFHLPRPSRFQPSFNITPAQKILSIVELEDTSLKAVHLFWGLVPSWAKDSKNSHHLINARAETIREKPSFRVAFDKRRCLIVASGFFEWKLLDLVLVDRMPLRKFRKCAKEILDSNEDQKLLMIKSLAIITSPALIAALLTDIS